MRACALVPAILGAFAASASADVVPFLAVEDEAAIAVEIASTTTVEPAWTKSEDEEDLAPEQIDLLVELEIDLSLPVEMVLYQEGGSLLDGFEGLDVVTHEGLDDGEARIAAMTVPGPSALAILAAAGLVAGRRRR